jgi:hypothetical protein
LQSSLPIAALPVERSVSWQNLHCHCPLINRQRLALAFNRINPIIYSELPPHLLANTAVFVPQTQLDTIRSIVHTLHRLVQHTNALANKPRNTGGILQSYDFHLLDEVEPQLIEINTNAGGVMLGALAYDALDPCLHRKPTPTTLPTSAEIAAHWVRTLIAEWQQAHRADRAKPATVAIVDNDPSTQFLRSEFLLYQSILAQCGIRAVIADPSELTWDSHHMVWRFQPNTPERSQRQFPTEVLRQEVVDILYNRTTDFLLQEPRHTDLLAGFQQGGAITPNPFHYQAFADKINLVRFSNAEWLAKQPIDEALRELLIRAIPPTLAVVPAIEQRLWQDRKSWFFKPCRGYASKAAFRGDKITQRNFSSMFSSADNSPESATFVAQRYVSPSARCILVGESEVVLKFDVRAVAYDGEVQWFVARLYQGQTTNMRTPGGGIAPVIPWFAS